jgi:hypothetical protein
MSEILKVIAEDPSRNAAKIRCIAYAHQERLGNYPPSDWDGIFDEMNEGSMRIEEAYRKAIENYYRYNGLDIT